MDTGRVAKAQPRVVFALKHFVMDLAPPSFCQTAGVALASCVSLSSLTCRSIRAVDSPGFGGLTSREDLYGYYRGLCGVCRGVSGELVD